MLVEFKCCSYFSVESASEDRNHERWSQLPSRNQFKNYSSQQTSALPTQLPDGADFPPCTGKLLLLHFWWFSIEDFFQPLKFKMICFSCLFNVIRVASFFIYPQPPKSFVSWCRHKGVSTIWLIELFKIDS